MAFVLVFHPKCYGFMVPVSHSRTLATELRSYAGLQTKSLYSCFPSQISYVAGVSLTYASTLIVECNSQAVLVLVIRRTSVAWLLPCQRRKYYQALFTASRVGAWINLCSRL